MIKLKRKSLLLLTTIATIVISSLLSFACGTAEEKLNAAGVYNAINELARCFEPGFSGFGATIKGNEFDISPYFTSDGVSLKLDGETLSVAESDKAAVSEYQKNIKVQSDFITPTDIPDVSDNARYIVYCSYTGEKDVKTLSSELRGLNASLFSIVYRTDGNDSAPVLSANMDGERFLSYVLTLKNSLELSSPNYYKTVVKSGLFSESQVDFKAKYEYLAENGCKKIGIAVSCFGKDIAAVSNAFTVTKVIKK